SAHRPETARQVLLHPEVPRPLERLPRRAERPDAHRGEHAHAAAQVAVSDQYQSLSITVRWYGSTAHRLTSLRDAVQYSSSTCCRPATAALSARNVATPATPR